MITDGWHVPLTRGRLASQRLVGGEGWIIASKGMYIFLIDVRGRGEISRLNRVPCVAPDRGVGAVIDCFE